MSLSLGSEPGFTDLPDSTFNTGNPITQTMLESMSSNAEFAAVRNEQFWGYYRNGETVELPTSPSDGYNYSRDELVYSWSIYWTGSAPNPLNGTQSPPVGGATSGQGTLLQMQYNVNQSTGLVACTTSYYKTSEQDTNDGILMVITHAQRSR